MQAVILAGGLGTRLRPLTNSVPKPMVLVNGRPFLEYQIDLLKKKGIELVDNIETENYYIYHGDRDAGLRKLTILGHEHPSLVLRDRIGGIFKIPAFVYNKVSRILITPAMSFFSSGTDVTQSLLSEEHFTPVLRHSDSRKFRVYGITEEFGIVDFGYVGDLHDSRQDFR